MCICEPALQDVQPRSQVRSSLEEEERDPGNKITISCHTYTK